MAKEKDKTVTQSEKDYYKLNTEAADRLAKAHKGTARKVSDEEINKYRSSKLGSLPVWVKALFIKFWFAGAACFFFYWGLAAYIPNWLDQMLVMGVGLGILTDILTNNVLRFFSGEDREFYPYMMFPSGKYWTFVANIAYAFLLLFLTIQVYRIIGIGVEPIVFGIVYTAIDMLFITLKGRIMNSLGRKANEG
ncbi:MAG: hypothetical protein E7193_04135 [Erysipelotrichaceae bacterium]|nr:hypothetical protein [Erysipelotrichaceae bacterium]